jgi:hypothetical protein
VSPAATAAGGLPPDHQLESGGGATLPLGTQVIPLGHALAAALAAGFDPEHQQLVASRVWIRRTRAGLVVHIGGLALRERAAPLDER